MEINYQQLTKSSLSIGNSKYNYYSLSALVKLGYERITNFPLSIKILLECLLRNYDGHEIMGRDVENIANWQPNNEQNIEIPFKPARVILQDFTGVPALVDLAAMRDAMKKLGGDAKKINPLIPVDLVIDHSIQIDYAGSNDAFEKNLKMEFSRNQERYEFLKWGQQSLQNFYVMPPSSGIIHQINLEYLAKAVQFDKETETLYPDSLVGTDSHTTMINGLGVLGWGVGGIEAEAVMLGQPIYMLAPQVIGFKITGALPEGATATDIALTVTQILRQKNVVGKFVEFYGSGLSNMTLADRATIANMAPEYGATMGFFPIDEQTLSYLAKTGRDAETIARVRAYCQTQGLFRHDDSPDPIFSDTLTLDLSEIEPSLAGPKRPQDRIALSQVKAGFQKSLSQPINERGFGLTDSSFLKQDGNKGVGLSHGSVVIASITSCTNTSNPSVLIAAGLLAQKALAKGLKIPHYVKTSLAPGSRVVQEYLSETGLLTALEALGFHIIGYGCATCIGNSGPIAPAVEKAIEDDKLIVASVLSGNRNFEGRIHAKVKANYLASPPLVIAYALAGNMNVNLTTEPLGRSSDNQDVYLRDIWPEKSEIANLLATAESPEIFNKIYGNIDKHSSLWNNIAISQSELFPWNEKSTYIQNPPFFTNLQPESKSIVSINNARVLIKVGDSITTDHISPAGSFAPDTPAGKYLLDLGVKRSDFNSYGSRRGNDRIMTRGTFANIRLKNQLAPDTEGGFTMNFIRGKVDTVFDASQDYQANNTPLIVLAGNDYGMGSSRDWAAKGTFLLGVRAVIAESYERIHRSNLVGMGVLPLQFLKGQNAESLGLVGSETFFIPLDDNLQPSQSIEITATSTLSEPISFSVICRIDTPIEVDYYRHGGILQTVLLKLARQT